MAETPVLATHPTTMSTMVKKSMSKLATAAVKRTSGKMLTKKLAMKCCQGQPWMVGVGVSGGMEGAGVMMCHRSCRRRRHYRRKGPLERSTPSCPPHPSNHFLRGPVYGGCSQEGFHFFFEFF